MLVAAASTGAAAQATTSGSAIDEAGARAASCVTRPLDINVVGPQPQRYTAGLQAGQAVDAATASWVQVGSWPVVVSGGPASCWYGGQISGTFPPTTTWAAFHHTGGISFHNADMSIVGTRVHNYGDAIDVAAGATNFRISDAHLSFIHDDCVQNDALYSGILEDSLLDGCYVALSARPAKSDLANGQRNTWTVRRSLIRLRPMPTVFKGHAPGTGGFFKWDQHKRAPMLIIRDTVFRADQRPNHGTLGLPTGYRVACSNNTMVWLGKGRFPARLPKCFHVPKDVRVWRKAVQRWHAAHPLDH